MRYATCDDSVLVKSILKMSAEETGILRTTAGSKNAAADVVMFSDFFRRTSFSGSQKTKHLLLPKPGIPGMTETLQSI